MSSFHCPVPTHRERKTLFLFQLQLIEIAGNDSLELLSKECRLREFGHADIIVCS
jgi:hypothetical protein